MMDSTGDLEIGTLQRMDRPARKLVLIASSMGGTKVLHEMLPLFKDPGEMGLVIVQHMPKEFTTGFAERLNRACGFPVSEAGDGDRICAGKALLAPGGIHSIIEKGSMGWLRIKTLDGPSVKGVKPAADVLFSSAANVVRIPIIVVVLTGMGSDGADGVFEIRKNNALVITQSESTCSVYGMPKAVDERGMSDISLPPERIPDYIRRNAGSVRRKPGRPVDEFRIGI
jgi:two-component system chemotaxis response regulator CheB